MWIFRFDNPTVRSVQNHTVPQNRTEAHRTARTIRTVKSHEKKYLGLILIKLSCAETFDLLIGQTIDRPKCVLHRLEEYQVPGIWYETLQSQLRIADMRKQV